MLEVGEICENVGVAAPFARNIMESLRNVAHPHTLTSKSKIIRRSM